MGQLFNIFFYQQFYVINLTVVYSVGYKEGECSTTVYLTVLVILYIDQLCYTTL